MPGLMFSLKLQKAVRFAIRTHEGYQKQKRKGKDLPYITHPLIVGMLLSRAGATEDVIAAGILHDTIEDSPPHKRVTKELLAERFGEHVAALVESVTEQDKSASWNDRKKEALDHIAHFSDESVLVKSADLASNLHETVADFEKEGQIIFERFNAPRENVIAHWRNVIAALLERMSANPFRPDFESILRSLLKMEA